jgi:hypothetical protein
MGGDDNLAGSAMIHNFADRSGSLPGSLRIDPDGGVAHR